MEKQKIAFINESSIVSDDEARLVMNALQTQVTNDFFPVWGIDAQLNFFSSKDTAPAEVWQLIILDNTDQADELGYHDATNHGLPLGKIFAITDKQHNSAWSVTASHELLEMLVDPDINQSATRTLEDGSEVLYAKEVCDACEIDTYGYKIAGILVSDFVYPSWFRNSNPSQTQFDFRKKIKQSFELLAGGIISVNNGNGWSQIYGRTALSYKMRAHVGSRRERRSIPRNNWLVSDIKKIKRPEKNKTQIKSANTSSGSGRIKVSMHSNRYE